MSLIAEPRSIIPACDVPLELFRSLVEQTADIPQIGAYKLGASLGLSVGLRTAAQEAKQRTPKPLIYDHQKAGTDIPDTAEAFMATLKEADVDAVILFPLAGSQTQATWTAAARAVGLTVLVGGHMTHPGFLASQGGYIEDAGVTAIYQHAAGDEVTDYVVPGNKPDVIRQVRSQLIDLGIDPTFYAPGFIAQSGSISDAAREAGPRWHAIVGRGIFQDAGRHNGIKDAASRLIGNLG